MSIWSLFIALTALAVALFMRDAVWRPRDGRRPVVNDGGNEPSRSFNPDFDTLVTNLQNRVESLEADVDDLNRITTSLREENEYLQQRLDAELGGQRSGGGS